MSRRINRWPRALRRRHRLAALAGISLGAIALAGCLPPSPPPAPATTTTTRPPTTTTTKPAIPTAPGGVSTPGLQINGEVENFPDPFVLRIDDDDEACGDEVTTCYYAYATQAGFLGLVNVPVARSTDLVTWSWAGPETTSAAGTLAATPEAMPDLAAWVDWGANWAPTVIDRGPSEGSQRFVMYYTAKSKVSPTSGFQCVGMATSSSPGGPFVDTASAPKLCNTAAGGTIDPDAFRDSAGLRYLMYADDDGIKAQRLSSSGLSLTGGQTTLLLRATGYSWEQQRVEGPSMFQAPTGALILLYSAGTFDSPNYSVGVLQCTSPLGSCTHVYSTPVLATRGSMVGPGGQSPFQLPDGSWQLAFHAWPGAVNNPPGRTLRVLPMTFPFNKPKVG